MKKDKVLFNIWIENQVKKNFKEKCDENDQDMSKVIRRLIKEWIKKNS